MILSSFSIWMCTCVISTGKSIWIIQTKYFLSYVYSVELTRELITLSFHVHGLHMQSQCILQNSLAGIGVTYLSLFSPLPRSPILHEAYYLILEDLQGQPALGPSPPPVTLHSQKVPIHNQDVYCFEQISFPSVLFLLAMESSWEGFDSSAMNLKAVLKTPLQLLFRQPSKLDSVSVCHTERRLSPHLALCWESHNHFGG